jgi:type II secretory ATPase GspE/PulE/Tfp pilus assembly ATPase PilB-like protein
MICPHCKSPTSVDRDYLLKIGFPAQDIATTTFKKGLGCEECRQLGYQGRTGIHELLMVTEAIRPLVMNRAPATNIGQAARNQGMRSLREDGWRKVRQGVTTLEEVLRVTQTEEHIKGLLGEDKVVGK